MDDVIWLRPERAGRGPAPEHSRAELLSLMADRVAAEARHPAPSGDPVRDLTQVTRELVAIYVRHPWAHDVVTGGVLVGPNAVAHLEQCLAILAPLTGVPA